MRVLLVASILIAMLVSPSLSDPALSIDRGSRLEPGAAPGRPIRYREFALREADMASALLRAPRESAAHDGGVEIALPLPDGHLERFRARETRLLGDALRLRHPEIHAYLAVGIDHPEYSARVDLTSLGLRASIQTLEGTAYLDPLVRGRADAVMSYWDRDVAGPGMFECRVDDRGATFPTASRPRASFGGQLHTLRLALNGTGEYTQYLGGVSNALAEMVTSINRVNAIFERDLGVRFVAVGLTPFPDSNTDPYLSVDIDRNQVVADSLYGPDGYDVCQLEAQQGPPGAFSGVSYLPAVCSDVKAGSSVTNGDVTANDLMIKVMCHELAHTLGAHHTGDAPCQSDPQSSVEPGSGTTIMARAGKCGVYDVVPPPGDLFFHAISIGQMADTLSGLADCGAFVSTGDSPPTADAGPDHTIPRDTPFVLTGSGSDADPTDVLTYSWDQMDIGTVVTDTIAGPIFRFRAPATTPTRYIPAFGTVLADTLNRWERLPVIDRLLHFRLVVRDNHPGGGGVAWDDETITVSGAPFALTYPQGAETVSSGSFTVTWDVGGGSVAPTVNIDLSTDGGTTWSSLAANTPNDGSETVAYFSGATLPQCRVRVSAVGNIFYSVSRANFTLQGGATDALPGPPALALRLLSANPSRTGARFEVRLPGEAPIDLAVYSVSGKLVRTLASGRWPAGPHQVEWDGTAAGRASPAGVYVIRFSAGGAIRESRFVLVR
jgi:hypothetical protein